MKRLQALFVAVVIGSIWVSPACKSNEVNQEEVTNNTYKSVVGPAGKTFENPEGVKIRIPAGALDEEVEVSITEAAAGSYPPTEYSAGEMGTAPWTPAGKVWAFQPHGLKFYVESTMWLPAPPGDYYVFKAQPGGTWELLPITGKSVDGKVEFTTKSFSFYALRTKEPFVPSGDAMPPSKDPCGECQTKCEMDCGIGNSACIDGCISTDCAGPCGVRPDAEPPGGDGSPGTTDTSVADTISCTPMCPPSPAGPGSPCSSCGTPRPCTASSGTTTWDCMCDPGGILTACTPRPGSSDAGADTSTTDSGDAGRCGGCPATTVPMRPGDTTSPCCKLMPSSSCPPPSSPLTNECTGTGEWICRDGMTCL